MRLRASAAAAAVLILAGPAMAQPAAAPAAPTAAPAAPAPSAGGAYRPIAPAGDILATLQASGEFNTFVKAVTATNLATVFKTQPNITVLAPTDAAFAALPNAASLFEPANVAQLQKLVTYHLINARLDSSKIKGHAATPVPTVANTPVTLDGSGPVLKANDATVLQPDVLATNGVILVVDKVLSPDWTPPPAAAAPAPAAPAAPALGAAQH